MFSARSCATRQPELTPPPRRTHSRLEVNQLEDRTVPSTVTIAANGDATEGGSSGSFRVSRDDSPPSSLSVNIIISGSATPGADYSFITSTATIPANQSYVDVTVTPVNDSTAEPTESVVATIGTSGSYTVGNPSAATVQIFDNDADVVSVAKLSDAVEGDSSNGHFRFTRLGDLSGTLVVNYSLGGTAVNGTDYVSLVGSVTFAGGAAYADAVVQAGDDGVYDPDETVILTLASGSGYSIGTPSSATINIDDAAQIVFTVESNQGVMGYTIPWGNVDPDQASQSLALTDFSLSLAGETLTPATADFTTNPTAEFEYGQFVGLSFAIDTSGISGFPYTSVSMSGLNVTAQPPVGDAFIVAAAPKRTSLSVDFSAAGNTTAYELTIWVYLDGLNRTDVTITVSANTTGPGLRDAVWAALKDEGIDVTMSGEGRLVFQGTAANQFKMVRFNATSTAINNLKVAESTAVGNIAPKLNINGTDK
jgi:hypothetical protein